MMPMIYEKDEAKKKEMFKALCTKDKLPYWFNKYNARLEENEKRGNKSKLLVGDKLSIADCKLYYLIGDERMRKNAKDILYTPNAKLLEFMEAIEAMDVFKKFRKQFEELQKENKEKKTTSFKYGGKSVCGSL